MSTPKKIIYSLNVDNEYIENNSNIHEKVYDTNYQSYSILHTECNTNYTDDTKYHSVILEYPSKRLLSFAPPKNLELSINEFISIYKNTDNDNKFMYINEFVEGTLFIYFMI